MKATAEREATRSGRLAADALLVVGVGNPLAGDDSAGAALVERLRAAGKSGFHCLTLRQPGPELLSHLREAEVTLLVDAVLSGAAPGTLHLGPLLDAGVKQRNLCRCSSHGWEPAQTVALANALGASLPDVALLGIEAGQISPVAPRSPAVEQAIALVIERFPALLAQLCDPASALWRGMRKFPPGDDSFPGGA